jgi:predicted DsbA family dithiol-disulfide isomerase
MEVKVWSDYICPWCYLGRDRTALLRTLDVVATPLPFELHPELPPQGRHVKPNGRLAAVYGAIGRECEAIGMSFRARDTYRTAAVHSRRRRWSGEGGRPYFLRSMRRCSMRTS